MKKKVALTAAAVALVGTLAVGGTLAWFTDTETATNVVTTGNVDIAWYENGEKITAKNPGVEFGKETPITPNVTLPKKARVKNEGKNAALIRAKVEVADELSKIIRVDYNLGQNDNAGEWLDGEDGWYYYNRVVAAVNGDTVELINSLTIPETVGNKVASGSELVAATDIDEATVELLADAIQAENMAGIDKPINYKKEYGVEVLKAAFGSVEKTHDIESYDVE